MRKFLSVVVASALVLLAAPATATTEVVGTIVFSGTTSSISATQKKSIQNLVARDRVQMSITCTALVFKGATTTAKNLAAKRAKAVCDQAKLFALKSAKVQLVTTETVSKALIGKVDVKIEFETGPNQDVTLTNLDPVWTEEKAWKEIQDYLAAIPKISLNPAIRFTNNVVAPRRTQAQSQIDTVYRFWSPYFKPQPSQVDVLIWHDKDLTSAQNTYDQMLRGGSSQVKLADGILYGKTNYCAHASAVQLNTNPQTFIFHQCVGSGSTSLAERHTTPHEYTHFVHFQFGNMPIWVTEGSATFYGEALGIYPVDYGRRVLDTHRNALFQSYDAALGKPLSSNTLKNLLKRNDPSIVKQLFATLESPRAASQADNTAAYLLGSFATTALIANFGHEKFVAFMKSFGTNPSYEANFSAAFGMSPSQFYEYLTPYLASNPSVKG